MITAVKQYLNAIFMYLYLIYYRHKLNKDFRYMVAEAFEHGQVLSDN